MPKRSRTMKGGFFESLTNWGNSVSQGASDLWNKTKKSTTSAYNSMSGTPSYGSTSTTTSTSSNYGSPNNMYGGKTRKMRGGVVARAATVNSAYGNINSGYNYGARRGGAKSRKNRRGGYGARAAVVANNNNGTNYGVRRGGYGARAAVVSNNNNGTNYGVRRGGYGARAAVVSNNSGSNYGYGVRRGGSSMVNPRTPLNNVASNAAPISNVKTANAHNWVGGRRRLRGGVFGRAAAANANYNNGSYGVRRGGYHARTPLNNIASNAAPFDVAPSAKGHR